MLGGAKRLKTSKLISWQPILNDDYLRTEFHLEPYMVADIRDKKQTTTLIKDIQEIYPLESQFKRVRAIGKDLLQILITEKKHFKGLGNDLESKLTNLSEIKLPTDRILTRKQFDLVTASYWPIQFHPDKRIESMLDRTSFEKTEEKLIIRSDYYSRLVAELAQFYGSTSAALIVDPQRDKIVGSGLM